MSGSPASRSQSTPTLDIKRLEQVEKIEDTVELTRAVSRMRHALQEIESYSQGEVEKLELLESDNDLTEYGRESLNRARIFQRAIREIIERELGSPERETP
jgi:3'-phosphoadenosine 5'-phosphosulfate sulfotransferase